MPTPSRRRLLKAGISIGLASLLPRPLRGAQPNLPDRARAAMTSATAYLRSIATHGGYLWSYSPDLRDRRGEGKATESQIWVQPPGTPAVGMALLRAYHATKDPLHLAAAKDAGEALAYGQLDSGGWHYAITFDERADKSLRRALAANLAPAQKARLKNITTFDDDNTQSAVRFLLALTQAPEPAGGPAADAARARRIQDALDYALAGMLRAQYPNGAFPQGYMGITHKPEDHPIKPASFPAGEPSRIKEYWFHYTLNDHCHRDCILTLLEAHRRLKDDRYLAAARRAGDFLLRAQLPAPQPVWAQQYDFAMQPTWARKFEPGSVCSAESVGAIRTLVDLYLYTGSEEYLKPIPAALEWFERSKLADGRWARFYELKTNKPLYFTRDYKLVYTDNDVPTHYSFQGDYHFASAAAYFNAVKSAGRDAWLKAHPPGEPAPGRRSSLAAKVRPLLDSQDEKGRWITEGRIEMRTFIANLLTLSAYLEATE